MTAQAGDQAGGARLPVSTAIGALLLGRWLAGSSRLGRTLARWEASVYHQAAATPPDLVVKLHVSPAVASARRPEARPADTHRRTAIIQALHFPPTTRVIDIDADQPLDQVAHLMQQAVSEVVRRRGTGG